MSEGIHRDLGKHDAQIEALKEQVNHLHEDMKQVMEQLSGIQQTLSEAKGGWRTLLWISGLSATIGGVVVKVAMWLQTFPR
jgi:prefoldin subunit 5